MSSNEETILTYEDQSAALLAAIKEYEASKWKVIGQKVGKPAKVRKKKKAYISAALLTHIGMRAIREGAFRGTDLKRLDPRSLRSYDNGLIRKKPMLLPGTGARREIQQTPGFQLWHFSKNGGNREIDTLSA